MRGPEFLIIYHDTFKGAAETLARWKNMRGLRTETVSIGSVGNSVNQIKTYIRNRREGLSRLRYVLLFGDVDMIKSELVTSGPWGDNITDYYYSTASDPSGPTDLVMPWLAIGRIPVRTAAEGIGVVNQIISYERRPPTASDYYERMAFAAYFQDNNGDGKADRGYMQTMESIREHMITLGFNVERIYVSTPGAPTPAFYIDNTPVPADVANSIVDSTTATNRMINATTQGQLIAGHRDHGVPEGWHEPPFNKSHLDSVTGKMPTMFYSINCLTGQFDLSAPTESFAEKLLRIEGAAPSLVAATRVSHSWLNNDLMKAQFDAMWAGVLPTFPGATASYPVRHNRLGDILNYGKAYLPVALSGSAQYIKDHFEIYHVVGDPTLEIWRARPLRATIRAWVEGRYLHIKLYRVLKDSVITIWSEGKMLRRLEPSSLYMKISLPWTVAGQRLSVCFWAPGYRFREVRPRIVLREDCISFDYRRAEVKNIGGRWKIVVANMWLLDFGASEAEARQALRIMQHYRMNGQCFVGRPDPLMEYYLVNGAAPVGSFAGEDCVDFDPSKIAVRKIGGRWKIVEGSHWIIDFGDKENEARTAFQIIKKYGFNHICFVGRPDPSMTYFRR